MGGKIYHVDTIHCPIIMMIHVLAKANYYGENIDADNKSDTNNKRYKFFTCKDIQFQLVNSRKC